MSLEEKLIKAAIHGNLEEVKLLVSKGADIHADNDAALCLAALEGYLDIVKYLVEQGADIHMEDDFALRWSASQGHLGVVKFLVELGADIHAGDGEVLRNAALKGHTAVVKYLLSLGLDVSILSEEQLIKSGLLPREDVENRVFERVKKYNISNIREVYNTLPNELLYKLRSYMQVKGLDSLDIKNVYNPKHPLYKVFGEYVEDKPFLIKNFVFKIEDLNNILDKESEIFNLSYDIYDKEHQQHLNKENLVIQLNFKEEYLEKIFEIQGSDFKDFYEKISKLFF